jgi:hypothetical protein
VAVRGGVEVRRREASDGERNSWVVIKRQEKIMSSVVAMWQGAKMDKNQGNE